MHMHGAYTEATQRAFCSHTQTKEKRWTVRLRLHRETGPGHQDSVARIDLPCITKDTVGECLPGALPLYYVSYL